MANTMNDYNHDVESFRNQEYPMLREELYLDHAGTTLYSKSLMERFSADMISNLYGNPHSSSASSQLSTRRIEDLRLRVLQFFNADPEDFDVAFVANATTGMKLVMDAFRGIEGGFRYTYHKDSHTSLVGIRENANSSQCVLDEDVEQWLSTLSSGNFESHPLNYSASSVSLFAYPAQSNMDGRKLPLRWASELRQNSTDRRRIYTLLDAAALVSTSPLDLSDADAAPDFTVLSFNKIFGFPDLGALIVRKESSLILQSRKYFGGGTVEMVVCMKEQWHAPKEQSLHEVLEDGTLAIHSIMALQAAMDVHAQLFKSMDKVSNHTMFLAQKLYNGLKSLKHANGKDVCRIYAREGQFTSGNAMQGPTVAFNISNSYGAWVSNAEVEKLATVKAIHIRTGGLCNPGGIATALDLSPWDMKSNFSAGFRCGNDNDIMSSGKPTGVIRASLGSMSTIADVNRFVAFIDEFYKDRDVLHTAQQHHFKEVSQGQHVESLTIYPVKSCGGFSVPCNMDWEVRPEGLAWDREWCLVHLGTGQALSQKRYPRMVLLRPSIDLEAGMLRVRYVGEVLEHCKEEISVPLSSDPTFYSTIFDSRSSTSRVCGDAITARTYSSDTINEFFTRVLDVPCGLARFPAGGTGPSARHAKAHMQRHQKIQGFMASEVAANTLISGPPTPPDSDNEASPSPILLSNESPILMIHRASIDSLNSSISVTGGKLASPYVFRANIVIAGSITATLEPYSEDYWSGLRIGQQDFRMLGSCRRCYMICVDQDTAVKDEEPFVTLAKTRRFDGKVFFGSHMCHVPKMKACSEVTKEDQYPTIRVGDKVEVLKGNQ